MNNIYESRSLHRKLILAEDIFDESTELLTEAEPGQKLRKSVTKNLKRAQKADAKLLKHAEKLVGGEMNPKFRDYKFYLYDPERKTWRPAQTQQQVKSAYQNMNTLESSPEIANAIVVTPAGYIHRRGLENLAGKGIVFNEKEIKLKDGYRIGEDPTSGATEDNTMESNSETEKKDGEESEADKMAKAATSDTAGKTMISPKLVNNYKQLLKLTGGMDVWVRDTSGKIVKGKIDDLTATNATSYIVKINNKAVPVSKHMSALVARNYLHENMRLTEAPTIQLTDDELDDPSAINFKDIIKDRTDKEEAEKAAQALDAKRSELRAQHPKVTEILANASTSNADDVLEELFRELVPSSGMCDTVGGEIVRAIMRLLYRDANDGDKFFEGYGIETCGSSAEYLMDGPWEDVTKALQEIEDKAARYSDDEEYTEALNHVTELIIAHLAQEPELVFEVNDIDSRDYDATWVTENQPTYDFEFYASDDLDRLIYDRIVNSWKLCEYVETQLSYYRDTQDATIERPWGHYDTSVTVTGLTKDGLDYIQDNLFRDVDAFWQELVDEYKEELEDKSEEDDDYEDID